MMKNWKKTLLSYTAVALAAMIFGSGMTMAMQAGMTATADTPAVTTVITSPFTDAVAKVHDSVVGVTNYQKVRYSNGNNYGSMFPFDFGFGGFGGFGGYNGYDRGNGSRYEDSYTEQEVKYGTGSGVVVGEGGYVLTNYHVVDEASRLEINVGEETFPATLLAYDANLDVAVLQAPDLKLNPVVLGDSDTLLVGDWAICIGNPLTDTLSGTVTAGIVSALNREFSSTSYDKYGRRETVTTTMIQTDAAINNGNSGGGMFSVAGELMGIPSRKYSGNAFSSSATVEGIGLCIPINAAKPIIAQAIAGEGNVAAHAPETTPEAPANNGLVGKPRMGVTISTVNGNTVLAASGILPKGVYVSEVEENGPAAKAGMQAGDIIVDVNDTVITSATQLTGIISELKAGDELQVKVYRVEGLATYEGDGSDLPDGEYVDMVVTLAVVDTIAQ